MAAVASAPSAARQMPKEPPPCWWHPPMSAQSPSWRKGLCEIVRACHEGWGVGGGHQENLTVNRSHKRDPGHRRLLAPSPVLGMYILPTVPTEGAASRKQPWESQVLLRPPGWYTRLNTAKVSTQTFKILAGRCGDLRILGLLRTSLRGKFPCLLHLSLIHLKWPASLQSLPVLCVWGRVYEPEVLQKPQL